MLCTNSIRYCAQRPYTLHMLSRMTVYPGAATEAAPLLARPAPSLLFLIHSFAQTCNSGGSNNICQIISAAGQTSTPLLPNSSEPWLSCSAMTGNTTAHCGHSNSPRTQLSGGRLQPLKPVCTTRQTIVAQLTHH